MNFQQFAHAWLEQNGLFDKDSDYDGWLGSAVEEVIAVISTQHHSGGSASRLFDLLERIYKDYDDENSPLWKAYFESDEGKRLLAAFQGEEPNHE